VTRGLCYVSAVCRLNDFCVTRSQRFSRSFRRPYSLPATSAVFYTETSYVFVQGDTARKGGGGKALGLGGGGLLMMVVGLCAVGTGHRLVRGFYRRWLLCEQMGGTESLCLGEVGCLPWALRWVSPRLTASCFTRRFFACGAALGLPSLIAVGRGGLFAWGVGQYLYVRFPVVM